MSKITFMGAGSTVFAKNVLGDCMCTPSLQDSDIRLYDIDRDRLEESRLMLTAINNNVNEGRAKITCYLGEENRKAALTGADFVVNAIQVGGYEPCTVTDFEIPKKYGLRQTIADTLGIGGIMRALRTIPVMDAFARDMEEVCPDALFLNYTNPMAMLCKAMQTYTDIEVTGLCHSVQGSAKMLADWIGAPLDEITYTCAGVNHQAFYLKFDWNGKDAYPLLREKLKDPEYYNKEQVRNEMFRHLDYYVTESSGHNSEYNQWFRKRPDLIEKYCTHGTGWNPGEYAYSLNLHMERDKHWREQLDEWLQQDFSLERGNEYSSYIFNARFGDHTPFQFNGNVINNGAIPNLPAESCVEIPCLADKSGIHPMMVGPLPDHLAILVNTTTRIENLVVDAAMTKDKRKVFQAVCMDPLTSAVCSLEEIHQMCDELFEINKEFFKDYK